MMFLYHIRRPHPEAGYAYGDTICGRAIGESASGRVSAMRVVDVQRARTGRNDIAPPWELCRRCRRPIAPHLLHPDWERSC